MYNFSPKKHCLEWHHLHPGPSKNLKRKSLMKLLLKLVSMKVHYSFVRFHIQIPADCNLSMECRDLLTRLLERNQMQRISFQDFFNHSFIDLEHIPGPSCLARAVSVNSIVVLNTIGLVLFHTETPCDSGCHR